MKQLAALIVFWIVISLMSTNILASTPTNNHELIEWKNKELSGTGGRSIDLIFGYVEKDIVSIYLYESPPTPQKYKLPLENTINTSTQIN